MFFFRHFLLQNDLYIFAGNTTGSWYSVSRPTTGRPRSFSTHGPRWDQRETRGRVGPLLTVETEANEDPRSSEYTWKGSFRGWFVGLVLLVQEIFVLPLADLVSPAKNILSSTLFYFICPHRQATWAGSRAASPVSLICVSRWDRKYES
jgi:hypothetical protein